jgi:hypothetical protein
MIASTSAFALRDTPTALTALSHLQGYFKLPMETSMELRKQAAILTATTVTVAEQSSLYL